MLLLVVIFVIFNTFKIIDYVLLVKDHESKAQDVMQDVIFTFLSSLLVIDYVMTMYFIIFYFLAIFHKFLSILKREMEFSLPLARLILWSTFITVIFGQMS